MVVNASRRHMGLRNRIGLSLGSDCEILEGLRWAAENDVHFVDFRPDTRSLDPESYPSDEVAQIKAISEENDIHFGLHSLSGVNTAAKMPYVGYGVEQYLRAYIDFADYIGAEWVIVHPGCHFTDDKQMREKTSITRLKRIGEYADRHDIPLVMCNMNPEPPDGEIHYLGTTVREYTEFAESISADHLEWAFNAGHAHLGPDGISGFLDGIDISRVGHVRVNDNRGRVEEHLFPGAGNIDFGSLFEKLEANGFDGHYTLTFGSWEDRLEGREYLLDFLPE